MLMRGVFQSVAVLGSGVMGAQIAAHFSNLGIKVILFDLGPENTLVLNAIKALKSMKPSPVVLPYAADQIVPANYETDLQKLNDCDLVIEAIAERLIWKHHLYEKIQPHLNSDAILVSNTSGLQIEQLSETLEPSLKKRFCGAHFFNPPRYMSLVELIQHQQTSPEVLDRLEFFLVHTLGKNVVRAHDTPNFIANRVGVFSMLATMVHAESFGLGIEVVDALTGPLIQRAKSATFRTADVVGLDTFSHVVQTMTDQLGTDPWSSLFQLPHWFKSLIEKGALGQKTQVGIYKKEKEKLMVFDVKTSEYRPALAKASNVILDILKQRDGFEKFSQLMTSEHNESRFIWSIFRDLFHYAAFHLQTIAEKASDLDLSLRWGFGWEVGVFEIWQQAGWSRVSDQINEDIHRGLTLSSAPLPAWVSELKEGPYAAQGSYSPQKKMFLPRAQNTSPILENLYQRQFFKDSLLHEETQEGQTILETDVVRLWTLQNDVAILNFKTKMNVLAFEVIDGLQAALERVTHDFAALILWQRQGAHFSVGADLKAFLKIIEQKQWAEMDQILHRFQSTCASFRSARIPVVAAIKGYAFGGGCEILLYTDQIVASTETYMGLVEAGVGLIPAGGGTTEMARRAALWASKTRTSVGQFLTHYWEQIAMGKVSGSAHEAQLMGYLRPDDKLIAHPNELLWAAHRLAQNFTDFGYLPPTEQPIVIGGAPAWANLRGALANFSAGGFVSEHDAEVADILAGVLCGSDLEPNLPVDQSCLFQLEREGFIRLMQTPKTLERIQYMLENGKPLRN